MLLFSAGEFFCYGKDQPNFFTAKIWAVFLGMAAMVMLYYTYSGIAGCHFLAADIAVYVASAALTCFLSYRMMCSRRLLSSDNACILAISLLALLIILFIYFTFHPPMSELFRDPVTEDFGIPTV